MAVELTMMLMVLMLNLFVQAKETPFPQGPAPLEIVREAQLPSASLSNNRIRLSNGFVYEIVSEDKHEFSAELSDFTLEEYEKFRNRRQQILLQLAKVLSYGKLSNGLGFVEQDKISLVKDGTILGHTLDALAEAEMPNSDVEKIITEQQKISRRHKLLNKILRGVDNFLFKNSNTAISSNEFGLDMALSLGSVIGGRGKYILGGSLGIQMVLGFDLNTRKMHFQLKLFAERATKGITGVFMPIGITPRIGGYMKASNKAPQSYEILYTPVAPMYMGKSNGMAMVGATAAITPLGVLSGGFLSFIEAAMSYQGNTKSITILDSDRFQIRVQQFQLFIDSLKRAMLPKPRVVSCSRIFA